MFYLYRVVSFKEKQEWDSIVKEFNHKDIYYFQEYCFLYYLIGDGDPYLFFYKDLKGNMVCYPFLKRTIDLPFLTKDLSQGEIFDITTPYGYGGPLTQHVSKQVMREFRKEFDEYCYSHNIVSEFVRFHPLLKNTHYLDGLLDIIYDRETVYIDLVKSEEEILSNYHKNHRRNLTKAKRSNLQFRCYQKEEAQQYIEDFYHLYMKTMDRLNAAPYYYFSMNYLKSLLTRLTNQSMIATVYYEDKMISAALCMYENGYLHYHLGCSLKEYLNLGTNIFLFHQAALWGKQQGCHTFHLGGGSTPQDSLFEFKHRFNPEGTLAFYIGKKIHNLEKYQSLVSSWERYYMQEVHEDFFPAYRIKPTENVLVKND